MEVAKKLWPPIPDGALPTLKIAKIEDEINALQWPTIPKGP